MSIQINFRCEAEDLERVVARIAKLSREARIYMDRGYPAACIAKYHAMDIELGRLANLLDDKDRVNFDAVMLAAGNGDNPPGK